MHKVSISFPFRFRFRSQLLDSDFEKSKDNICFLLMSVDLKFPMAATGVVFKKTLKLEKKLKFSIFSKFSKNQKIFKKQSKIRGFPVFSEKIDCFFDFLAYLEKFRFLSFFILVVAPDWTQHPFCRSPTIHAPMTATLTPSPNASKKYSIIKSLLFLTK